MLIQPDTTTLVVLAGFAPLALGIAFSGGQVDAAEEPSLLCVLRQAVSQTCDQ